MPLRVALVLYTFSMGALWPMPIALSPEDESRYAQVEKELLAATFTCKKFHDLIYGREAIIETDHKPITAIVNKASLFILHLLVCNVCCYSFRGTI